MVEELDMVEEEEQFTHMLTLEDAVNSEDILSKLNIHARMHAHAHTHTHVDTGGCGELRGHTQ